MPVRSQAEAPGGVDIAVLVDDDLGVPLAADLRDPAVGGVLGRVRDGDAVDEVGVGGGEGGQFAKGLFGDCRVGFGMDTLE